MSATQLTATHVAASVATDEQRGAGILIGLGIPFCICAATAIIVWAYFRLQSHRADAVAMASTASWPRRPWPTSRSCGPSWPS